MIILGGEARHRFRLSLSLNEGDKFWAFRIHIGLCGYYRPEIQGHNLFLTYGHGHTVAFMELQGKLNLS